MKSIKILLPDPSIILDLEPEELAGYVMEYLNAHNERQDGRLNKYNFGLHTMKEYPQEYRQSVPQAFMEAWSWLEREGLVASVPGEQGDGVFITRRGQKIRSHVDLDAFHKANLLPRELIHPTILQKVWSPFIRGEYDASVFHAYKEVEVAVRTVGKFSPTDIGVPLMRKAFDPERGPLTDSSKPHAEREALTHLFAGAIGSYKNPASHRHVTITDPFEAVEMIILASHLMRIVDSRI